MPIKTLELNKRTRLEIAYSSICDKLFLGQTKRDIIEVIFDSCVPHKDEYIDSAYFNRDGSVVFGYYDVMCLVDMSEFDDDTVERVLEQIKIKLKLE